MPKEFSNNRYQELRNALRELTDRVLKIEFAQNDASTQDSEGTPAPAADIQHSHRFSGVETIVKMLQPNSGLIGNAIALGALIITAFTLRYNTQKVDKLSGKIDTVKSSIETTQNSLHARETADAKLEATLRLLAATLSPQLTGEVDKLLHVSVVTARSGNALKLSAILDQVGMKVASLARAKIPAGEPFFVNTALQLDKIDTTSPSEAKQVNASRSKVAEYRSVVLTPTSQGVDISALAAITLADLRMLPKMMYSDFRGFRIEPTSRTLPVPNGLTSSGDGKEILFNEGEGDLAEWNNTGQPLPPPTFTGVIIASPSQKLDGITWKDVIFLDTHITYEGGPVTLINTRFINCTFEVSTPRGAPVLNYAIIAPAELKISTGM